jgi:hypothetical protein
MNSQDRTNFQFAQADASVQLAKLLASSNEALSCGPKCQIEKNKTELKQKLLDAQTNKASADTQIASAEKAYVTATSGLSGYSAFEKSQITDQANALCKNMQSTFTEQINSANSFIDTFASLDSNNVYVLELYNEYISKNNQLDTGIVDIRSDIVTADRKTFYETQNYDNLMKWYRIFKWIYILLLLAFFIGLFITKSDMSRTVKISAFIFLIIYPIVINYLVDFIIKSLKNAYNLMPKNIYKSL